MKRIRSLMIIHQFRPIIGGAELQAERLAIELMKRGHIIRVLTQWNGVSPKKELIGGVPVRRVTYKLPYLFDLSNGGLFSDLFFNIGKFDILHCHMAFGHALVAVVFGQCFHKKVIIKIACAGKFGELETTSKFAGFEDALHVLKQADRIVAVSTEVEKELIKFGFNPKRIARIPNGVDTGFFTRKEPLRDRSKKQFILIGRRNPQKGIDIALKALHILKKRGMQQRMNLSLFGSGEYDDNYHSMALKLGVQQLVEFYPFESNILHIYENADCFILPSRGEGLANTLLESMAMGLPSIATKVSGTTDVIEDGIDGLLIQPDDPIGLADAMESVISDFDKALILGKNARQKVENFFSLYSVAEQYSKLYEQLTS